MSQDRLTNPYGYGISGKIGTMRTPGRFDRGARPTIVDRHNEPEKRIIWVMIHLVYASAATHEFKDEELLSLLETARKNNREIDVTGMLLYVEGNFFQVLEGEEDAVEDLYRIICKDARHSRITRIIKETIAKRSFDEWNMAFVGATRKQLNEIDGLSEFFSESSSFSGIGTGRARKLLYAFSMGSWRKKLT